MTIRGRTIVIGAATLLANAVLGSGMVVWLARHGEVSLGAVVPVALAVALALAAVALLALEPSVLEPLRRLTREVSRVAASRDPSARVPAGGADELGVLAAEINRMLTALEAAQGERDRAQRELNLFEERCRAVLERDKERLEERVGERTAELEATVAVLEAEIADRQRAEDVATRAEEALRRSERYYRGLFEGAHDAILVLEPETGTVLDVNVGAAALYGAPPSELVGHPVAELCRDPEVDLRWLRESAGRSSLLSFETVHRRRDGAEVALEVNSSRVEHGGRPAVLTLCRDVTERRSLEDRLRQAEKLEAVGRLAAGVAHDFNNLLMVVMGSAELALWRLEEGSRARREVETIRDAAMRGRELTRSLLGYSRRQLLERQDLDLRAVAEGMLPMLRRVLPESITVALEAPGHQLVVNADRGQLEQVLMNLCVNARDAMPHGGVLAVAVDRAEVGPEFLAGRPWARVGTYGRLRVRDSGSGMTPAVLARVFEPFFTTKAAGAGTGMGLAMVYGIVKQHGGMVDISSAPGVGTTVDVYLPVSIDEVEVTSSGLRPAPGSLALGRGERILLVEDQPELRPVVARILGDLGYAVTAAGDGLEAAAVIAAEPSPFDLVIADLVMPHMGGLELHGRLSARGRSPRFLFTSGYHEVAAAGGLPTGPRVGFIPKPYDLVALSATIRSLLEPPA